MEKYKFRAEVIDDVTKLISHIWVNTESFTVEHLMEGGYPDCVVILHTSLPLNELKAKMATIEDGHVMLETITLASDYTGERN